MYIMHIGIFKRLGQPYDYVQTKNRKWLSHMKREIVGPDEAMIAYIRYMYPEIKVTVLSRNNMKDMSKYDIVFLGFEELTLPFKQLVLKKGNSEGYKKYVNKLENAKNLYPKFKYVDFVVDKCKYYKWLESINIKVSPTVCTKISEKTKPAYLKQKLKKTDWERTFIKPLPGAEGTNIRSFNKNNVHTKSGNLNRHIEYLKSRGFSKIVAQKFMDEFATTDYPELRTFWIGRDYQYTIETTGAGYDWNLRKSPIPRSVFVKSKKVLKLLEEKFNQELIITRLDWGYESGNYFLNEIEYAPGTFAEMFPDSKWDLDKKMGDKIVQITRKKLLKH